MIPLTMTIDEEPEALIVRLAGSAGINDNDALESGIAGVIARRPTRVVIDVSGLTFITSVSIGHLLALGRAAQAADGHRGGAVIAGASGEVAEALRRCRIEHLITLCPSVDDALRTIGK